MDRYINETAPFKLAKDETKRDELAQILYNCVEAIRIAAVLYLPALPETMTDLLSRFSCTISASDTFDSLTAWGGLKPGDSIVKGDALFMRADADAPAPEPAQTAAADS